MKVVGMAIAAESRPAMAPMIATCRPLMAACFGSGVGLGGAGGFSWMALAPDFGDWVDPAGVAGLAGSGALTGEPAAAFLASGSWGGGVVPCDMAGDYLTHGPTRPP